MSTWDAATNAWVLHSDERFLYDAWNLIASYRVTATGDLQLTATYLWGTDLSETSQGAGGIGGLLTTRQSGSGASHLPIDDGHGNITGYLDAVAHLPTARFEYTPFGEPRESWNPGELPFGFSSKFTDSETGLVYYGYRYYSPETGRWLSRDPIGERGGVNVYGMVGNGIVGRWDYLGMLSFDLRNCNPERTQALSKITRRVDDAIRTAQSVYRNGYDDQSVIALMMRWFSVRFDAMRYELGYNIVYRNLSVLRDAVAVESIPVVCECECDPLDRGYVMGIAHTGIVVSDIHLCPDAFRQDMNGLARTLIHEMTHKYIQTFDYGYMDPRTQGQYTDPETGGDLALASWQGALKCEFE